MGMTTQALQRPDPDVQVVYEPRNQTVADLVDACARGELPFSGPNSLATEFHRLGWSFNGAYEAVIAAKAALRVSP